MAFDKVPPSDVAAERAVLGAILIDTTGTDEDRVMSICTANGVTPETFYDPRNRLVYAKMREMSASAQSLDALTLADELRAAGKLETIGGVAYIQSLIDQVPTAAHAEHYVSIIRGKHLRRMLIDRATEVVDKSFDEGKFPDPQVVLGEAERSFLEISADRGTTMSWDRAIDGSFKAINGLFESNGNQLQGLSTGFKYLDETLQGLKAGEMIVVAARPSVGKTSLAMNIAESVALGRDITTNMPVKYDGGKQHPVLVFSLEMPVESLTKRMLAGRAGIDMWRLNRGMVLKNERNDMTQRLFMAVEELKRAPIFVDDTAVMDVMDMRARARRMKKQHGIELIVIDYLQLCSCRDVSGQGRQIEVSMISRQIKAMAKELMIPVIVLSQLSRANETRDAKYEKPKLSDLRDSGAIEQDADVVFLLRRPSRSAADPRRGDALLAIVDIAKNRNGETGEVEMDFIREFTRFRDRPPQKKDGAEGNVDPFQPQGPGVEQGEFQG